MFQTVLTLAFEWRGALGHLPVHYKLVNACVSIIVCVCDADGLPMQSIRVGKYQDRGFHVIRHHQDESWYCVIGYTAIIVSDVIHQPAIQVMQVALMFISSLPIAISIASSHTSHAATSRREAVKQTFVQTIQFDLLFLCVALLLVAALETASAHSEPINLWSVLYEVVSAYGTGAFSLVCVCVCDCSS